ncbi:MAG: LTA synthase family protein [Peptococcaceae bacterium]|nr:LTA synthase family protein [Peptococcaceae bacterium]
MDTFSVVFLVCLVWIILLEAVHRCGFSYAFRWMKTNPLDYLINVLFVYGLILPIRVVTGSVFVVPCGVLTFFFVLAVVSSFKHAARNEPLYFFELLLVFKITGVAGLSNLVITPTLGVAVGVGVGSLAGFFFLIPAEVHAADKILALIVFVIAVMAGMFTKKCDFTYLTKGFLRGFALNVTAYFKKPTPPSVPPSLSGTYDSDDSDRAPSDGCKQVNVIVVLSESFFDMTRIPGLDLSEDPLPFFRTLHTRAVTGTLLVTPIGGGTCAVEAEFLTGTVGRHFNAARPFYYSLAKRPIPSLASYFKSFGYEAHAIHTYSKTFYNRDNALKNMGFDSFTGAEDMPGARKDGFYISDAELTKHIIQMYDKKAAPIFLFGISMENHQPYTPDKYPETGIKVLNTGGFENRKGHRLKLEAETYLHGLRHADCELRRLVEFVDTQKDPTVLLFFGDHLGAVGHELSFYRKLGYIGKGALSLEDVTRMYSPEFLILSNYKRDVGHYELVGANFLPGFLLDYMEMPMFGLFSMLGDVFPHLRCMSRDDLYSDGSGRILVDLPPELCELEERLRAAEFAAMNEYK